MKPERIEEVATSFVNGNISWVKAQIRTKKDLAQIVEFMCEMGWLSERDSLLRIMSK